MTRAGLWWRSTIRVRLTLLYAGAFFLAGAVLVALMYLFMAQALDRQLTARLLITDEHLRQSVGGEPGALRVVTGEVQQALHAQFRQDRDSTLNSMLIASLVSLAIVGVAAGGFGWLMAGQALQPLREITATARRVADRSLHERIALSGPEDEIKDLADTLDAMLERLDRAFEGQRRFVANASHELRTPLAINRTLLEVALDDPQAGEALRQLGATLLAVNQRHERLIDGLLTLASSDQGITERTPVDLAEIARHVTAELQPAADQAGIALRAGLQFAPVAGDPVLLERLAHNLVDNAIRYNLPQDGWVAVHTEGQDGSAWLVVENTGPAVPAYDVPGLFQPFRRLPAAERLADTGSASHSRGAGLGLSIVRSVARAHGGDVHAAPREDGGLAVQVRLPALSE
jgi:signal transduction histidine kinase